MKKSKIFIVAALFLIFCLLTWSINKSEMLAFEHTVYQYIASFITPELTSIALAITNLGSPLGVAAIMSLLLLMPSTRNALGVPIVINMAVAVLLNLLLKVIIARPRPEILWLVTETGYGFPSGHAMNNAAFYVMLALLVCAVTKNKRVKISVIAFSTTITFLIGISRVYLGVHNVADVLAGWTLGIVVSICTQAAWQALQMKRQSK